MPYDKDDEMQGEMQGELPLELHDENPFLRGFRPRTRNKRTAIGGQDLAIVDMTTGVFEGTAEVTRSVLVDRESFTKIFQEQLGLFFGLTSPGVKVLAAVWSEVAKKPGEHSVYLSPKSASKSAAASGHALSRATYFRGRKNLLESGFIAASADPYIYWINPAIFFNGDRVKLVTQLTKPPEVAGPGEKFEHEDDKNA